METQKKEISLAKLQTRLKNEEDLKYNFHSILHLNDNDIHLHNLVTSAPKARGGSKKKDSKLKKKEQANKKYSPIDKEGFITQYNIASNVKTKRFQQAVIDNKQLILETLKSENNFGLKPKKDNKGKRNKPIKSIPEKKTTKKVKTK